MADGRHIVVLGHNSAEWSDFRKILYVDIKSDNNYR